MSVPREMISDDSDDIGNIGRVLLGLYCRHVLNRRLAFMTSRNSEQMNHLANGNNEDMNADLRRDTNSTQQNTLLRSLDNIHILNTMLNVARLIEDVRTNMLRVIIRPNNKIMLIDIMIADLITYMLSRTVIQQNNVTTGTMIRQLTPRKAIIDDYLPDSDLAVLVHPTSVVGIPHDISILRSMTLTYHNIRLPTLRSSMSVLGALFLTVIFISTLIVRITDADSNTLMRMTDRLITVLVLPNLNMSELTLDICSIITSNRHRLHYRALCVRIR